LKYFDLFETIIHREKAPKYNGTHDFREHIDLHSTQQTGIRRAIHDRTFSVIRLIIYLISSPNYISL